MSSITAGGKNSYSDFGALLVSKNIAHAQPKNYFETVPYSSRVYDFSRLDGSLHFDMDLITYEFEFLERTKQILRRKVDDFVRWFYGLEPETSLVDNDDIVSFTVTPYECTENEEGLHCRVALKFVAHDREE